MADNKNVQDGRDRAKVAKNQPYERSYFKRKFNLSDEQTNKILSATKGNRSLANEMALKEKPRP